MLDAFPLFSLLPAESVEQLMRSLRPREVRCGEVIVRQGERCDTVFFIVDGRFEMRVAQEREPPRVFGTLGRGEVIGIMPALTAEPPTGSVVAVRRSSVM